MNANPSEGDEPSNPAAEEKIREFCFELALVLRRITGRKIDQGNEGLPQMIQEAIEAANDAELTDQPGRPEK